MKFKSRTVHMLTPPPQTILKMDIGYINSNHICLFSGQNKWGLRGQGKSGEAGRYSQPCISKSAHSTHKAERQLKLPPSDSCLAAYENWVIRPWPNFSRQVPQPQKPPSQVSLLSVGSAEGPLTDWVAIKKVMGLNPSTKHSWFAMAKSGDLHVFPGIQPV